VTGRTSAADVPEYLAFGDLGVDAVAMIDHLPRADEKLWVEPVGDFPGGMMGNAAVAVASLGVSAGVVALIGSDPRGRIVMEGLRARGVDTRFVREIDAPTFWALSLTVASGDRTLIQFPTAAFGGDWEGFDRTLLSRTRWVHAIAEEGDPVGPLLEEARRAGATTSLDIEYPFAVRPELEAVLPHVEVAFMNAAAASALGGPGAGAKAIQDRGVPTVLVTLGEAGALLRDRRGRTRSLPAISVDAVDTNGAGDQFAGAYAAGILKGLSEEESAELAVLVAGRSTTVPGGHGPETDREGLRDEAERLGYAWWDRL
jgi:ribokinase